jgi:putative transposase
MASRDASGRTSRADFSRGRALSFFLPLLEDLYERYELKIHANSLMPNHYHLLVRSRHGNLSDAMRHLNGAYTRRVNRLERWDGPVFRGRFTSRLIRDETRLPFFLAFTV